MIAAQITFTGYNLHRLSRAPIRHPGLLLAEIQAAVAEHFEIPRFEMTSSRRSREVARPRQIAMYLSKQLTAKSLPEIGRRFGNRDHTTVIHAIRQIEKLKASDPEVAQAVDLLTARLGR